MAEANLTVEILKDIREDIRGLRSDQREQGERLDAFARDGRVTSGVVAERAR